MAEEMEASRMKLVKGPQNLSLYTRQKWPHMAHTIRMNWQALPVLFDARRKLRTRWLKANMRKRPKR